MIQRSLDAFNTPIRAREWICFQNDCDNRKFTLNTQVRLHIDSRDNDVVTSEDVDINYAQNYVRLSSVGRDGTPAVLIHDYNTVSTAQNTYQPHTHTRTHRIAKFTCNVMGYQPFSSMTTKL